MSAKNIYHDTVIRALEADGWTITADPFRIPVGSRDLYVDVCAERPTVAAERGGRRIAVEIQSFVSRSPVRDLEEAVGQYMLYRTLLADLDPDRFLLLAVPRRVHDGILSERIGQAVIAAPQLPYLVFDEALERVHQWINFSVTERSSGA